MRKWACCDNFNAPLSSMNGAFSWFAGYMQNIKQVIYFFHMYLQTCGKYGIKTLSCESSSVVELHLAKVDVAGSSPVFRSSC